LEQESSAIQNLDDPTERFNVDARIKKDASSARHNDLAGADVLFCPESIGEIPGKVGVRRAWAESLSLNLAANVIPSACETRC